MNSRERIRAVFEHQKVDWLPTDLGGTRKTGISVTAIYHLRQCIGAEVPVRLYDVYEGLAEMDPTVEDAVGCDTMRLPQPVPLMKIECLKEQTKKWWKPYAMEDRTGVLVPSDFFPERELNGDLCLRDFMDRRFAMMKRGGWKFEPLAEGPGASGMTLEDVEKALEEKNPAVALIPEDSYWELLQNFIGLFAKVSKKALIYRAGPPTPFFGGLGAREPLKWLEVLETRPDDAKKLLEKWFELWMDQIAKLAAASVKPIDVLVLEENFCGVCQDLDRQLIREHILPLYARGIQEIRAKLGPEPHILWQSEGNFTPFLPDLLAMGVEAVGFINLETSGVNPLAIKQEFGKDLVLWGGACSARDLADLNQNAVLRKVQENLAILSENGGYVHALAGNVEPGTDPENVLAYFSRRA